MSGVGILGGNLAYNRLDYNQRRTLTWKTEYFSIRRNETILEVFLACRSYIAHVVSRIVPPSEIEDIVQETYVRVCRFRPDRGIRAPRALLARIARNLALDHVKRAEWRLTSGFASESEGELYAAAPLEDSTFGRVASDEEFARFCEAVRQLPLQCRKVFVLKKVYGHSQREIAAKLGISESTVEKHIAKGMKMCHAHMERQSRGHHDSSGKSHRTATGQGDFR